MKFVGRACDVMVLGMMVWFSFIGTVSAASLSSQAVQVEQTTVSAGEAIADDVIKAEMRGYPVPITTATTTVLKSGPGWLHNCHILGGTPGTITIYDNTAGSGAVIVPTFTPPAGIFSLPFDAVFSVGAYVITSAATSITCVVR